MTIRQQVRSMRATRDNAPPVESESVAIASDEIPAADSNRRGRLVLADNLLLMRQLATESIDLIYIDPPFCSQQRRTSSRSPGGFDDRWAGRVPEFVEFLSVRLREMHRLLADSGSFYVHLDWRTSHYVKIALDDIFGEENFLNEIIWHYRTGGLSKHWFGRKHDTILLYAKNRGRHTFNVQRGGEFRTDGLLFDDDGRPFKSTKKGRLYFHPDGPALTDVWEMPFLSTVSNERTGYPSQKPMALLERIVRSSSQPGDLVADFFCGSGTTAVVANRLNRRWLACDIEEEAVKIAAERLAVQRNV